MSGVQLFEITEDVMKVMAVSNVISISGRSQNKSYKIYEAVFYRKYNTNK